MIIKYIGRVNLPDLESVLKRNYTYVLTNDFDNQILTIILHNVIFLSLNSGFLTQDIIFRKLRMYLYVFKR